MDHHGKVQKEPEVSFPIEWIILSFMSLGMMLSHFVHGKERDFQLNLSGKFPAEEDSKIVFTLGGII